MYESKFSLSVSGTVKDLKRTYVTTPRMKTNKRLSKIRGKSFTVRLALNRRIQTTMIK
jgi:hypothetical protein